jgi:Ca-activated chloride channel homolog
MALTAVAAAAVILALVLGGILLLSPFEDDSSTPADEPAAEEGCAETLLVQVAAAPEITPALELAAEAVPADQCNSYEISAQPARDVAAAIEAGRAPDVWVPDAADWTSRITEHRSGEASFTLTDLATSAEEPAPELTAAGWTALGSLARTPVVLAVGADPAPGNSVTPDLTWRDMFTSSVAIQMAQPSTNAASRLALDVARGAVPAETDDYIDLGQRMIFLSRFAAESDTAVFASEDRATGDVVPFPVAEQRLAAYVAGNPTSGLRPVIPGDGTPELTYPMYARADLSDEVTAAAEQLYESAGSEEVLAALSDAGFRTSAAPGPQINGVEAAAYEASTLPEAERAIATTRLWDTLRLDMRMLAAIDVSGSMRWEAGDSTRVELTQKATQDALTILPDGSQIGAWGFSTDRGPDGEDHFEIAPIRGLQTNVDGVTQRRLLSDEVAGIESLLGGDTGLYDTALAAYLEVQSGYDPAYVNSVVLITDGENDDSTGGLELDELLVELEAAADPERPVRIVAIGIGPDTDPSALQAMADATGGSSYVALQPSDIETVFFRALLARAA